ncbi:MAG: DUF86 domain-containing protein [Bacteroidetes bacterium]|nr:DUF86 domain-containing protein [Bacteroidota bacterium]
MFDNRVQYLFDFVLENIDIVIDRFSTIQNANEFVVNKNNKVLLDSIVIRLQVIGENIKKIHKADPLLLNSHPEIEWDKIINFRDLISHHYDMLDHEIVFDICSNDLVPLKKAILDIKK